jgi:hypothetical protein
MTPTQRRAHRELQDAIVAELVAAGAPKPAIAYVLNVLLGHGLSWAAVAQRVRREKERRSRIAQQASQKAELRARAVQAFSAACAYCSRSGTAEKDPDGLAWELDRIVPGRLGGEYSAGNVALTCHACNQKKLGNYVNPAIAPPSLADLDAAA